MPRSKASPEASGIAGLGRCSGADAETAFRASGTVRVMESSRSDVDCLAHSLGEPKAFAVIFERHLPRFTDISIGEPDVISQMSWPQRRSRSPLSGGRAAGQLAASCRGCTGSRRTFSVIVGGRSAGSCAPTVAAVSTGGPSTRTRRPHESTARLWRLGWHALSRRCDHASGMRCSSTHLPTSATRKSRSRSTSRSGQSARGSTGRAASHDASSRRRRTLSLSRHQELICMDELDLFRDFRSGVAAPSGDAQRRASALLASAVDGTTDAENQCPATDHESDRGPAPLPSRRLPVQPLRRSSSARPGTTRPASSKGRRQHSPRIQKRSCTHNGKRP